jgi:type I restriction enzyme, S subunit
VPQDPKDQPACELLKEIDAEKRRLVKSGKIKEPKPLPEIKPEEVPYELPTSWEWVRLGNIGEANPRNKSEDNIDAGFVPMPLLFSEYGANHKFEVRKWSEIKQGYTHFANGDVGLAKITPCFENAKSCVFRGLPNGIGAGTTELHVFRNIFGAVYQEYLLAYLKNPRYIAAGIPKMTGSAGQKRVPTDFFSQNPFPIPPLPEQRRIVAKIDQLMAHCDELEKLRAEREQKRLAVHTAVIKQLLDAEEQDSFTSAWQFITRYFGELYTVKENVAELRKAIFQLAVMGKLVPQNPTDPPASNLLKEIEAEKRQLVKEGKIKKSEPLPEIKPEETGYALPEGWAWIRLGEIVDFKTGKLDSNASVKGGEYPFFTCAKEALWINQYSYDCEAILLTGNNAAGKYDVKHYKGKFDAYQRTYVITTEFGKISGLSYGYLKYLLINMLDDLQSKSLGTLTRFLTLGILKPICIALPPLPEQHRIVAKIEKLMTLCDTLEQQIDASSGKQTELLNAVMAQV